MSDIFRHMSLLYWSACPNMPSPSWGLVGARGHPSQDSTQPPFPATACPIYIWCHMISHDLTYGWAETGNLCTATFLVWLMKCQLKYTLSWSSYVYFDFNLGASLDCRPACSMPSLPLGSRSTSNNRVHSVLTSLSWGVHLPLHVFGRCVSECYGFGNLPRTVQYHHST